MKISSSEMPQPALDAGRPLKPAGQSADKERMAARKAAKEFESLFVGMMLKSMRETLGKDMLAGKGQSEDIYRSLLDQEYAKSIADQGGLGLAKSIEKQLLAPAPPVKPLKNGGGEGEGR
jgi:peptidoglycan hydrolase FlgJ